MKTWIPLWVGLAVSLVLLSGTALAQGKPSTDCPKAGTPDKVEGQVVKVDPGQGKLTVRGPKGETFEFQASKETLQDYKVGDRIEAKLRSSPDCKPSAS